MKIWRSPKRAQAPTSLIGSTIRCLSLRARCEHLGNGGLEEGDSTLPALVGHDLHKGDARGAGDAESAALLREGCQSSAPCGFKLKREIRMRMNSPWWQPRSSHLVCSPIATALL